MEPPIRPATPGDADAIAALHSDSWQRTYRGMLSDAYLDGPVVEEHLANWRNRFADPRPDQHGWLVAGEDGLLGFVLLFGDEAPGRATWVDNLHVRHDVRGRGIGLALLRTAAAWTVTERPGLAMFLWVMAANHPARAFYRRAGGVEVERSEFPAPGGGTSIQLRCWWADPRQLLEPTG